MPRLKNRRAQGLVEYILIIFLMGIVSIVFIKKLSTSTTNGFTKSSQKLDSAFGG